MDKKIFSSYTFDTYMDGIDFVNNVAKIAEKKNHHPDINVGWCTVKLDISSHDMGGVTTNCINLAMDIDMQLQ